MKLDRVSFGYNKDNILLENVDLSINLKSRIALLGRNGQGKSTLIKLVIGALQPLSGQAKIDSRAKVEYLAQHQFEDLDPDRYVISPRFSSFMISGFYFRQDTTRSFISLSLLLLS